ncbi:unnamed protein product [Cuscuta europaea]|uniref:Uncharacterized protein n=1 Tax=Cuscuta europaea TaxID=41803 RepID=A0A9P0ZQ45_CUSEU|nr:unnamed protein product [Cuscuta europaea]
MTLTDFSQQHDRQLETNTDNSKQIQITNNQMTDNFTSLTNKYRHYTYKLSIRQTILFSKTHQKIKKKSRKVDLHKSFKASWSALSSLSRHVKLSNVTQLSPLSDLL